MLNVAMIFQNHMVLQREKKITVWGETDCHERVSVRIQNEKAVTIPLENGTWCVEIGPLKVSKFEEMEIICGRERILLTDILIGDVWLAGGQSNMEFYMRYDENYEQEQRECANSEIRFFDYPEVSYEGQLKEADYGKNFGFWRKTTQEDLEWFSAVAYYFAKELQEKLDIPIGIVGCNWGGTPACAWMTEEAIRKGKGEIFLKEYQDEIKNLDLEKYNEDFMNNPASWRTDPFEDQISELLMRGKSIEEIIQTLYGISLEDASMDASAMTPVIGPKYERRPCGLYHSMLSKIAPYGLKGFLFYQGETDGDTHPECYETLFSALIEDWRKLWNEELPFLFVQIAPLNQWMQCVGTPYVTIRNAQQNVADKVANTAMAVTGDCGMEFDIHPKKKKPVGKRLALQALQKVYGRDVLCEAPRLSSIDAKNNIVILNFLNTGSGLHLQGNKEKINGLKVQVNGNPVREESIEIEIKENSIVLASKEFQKGEITVSFGDGGWYQMNLFNSADIPVRPGKVIGVIK
ncbi:MAG: sialate O-acetylesterase [Lachnospiraceae bacterium]|nr:sialate O-acetylesterase [Lachnospiraceae bacterium]